MFSFGIDVSKQKLDVLWLRDAPSGKVKTKVFPNHKKGFLQLIEWATLHTQHNLSECQFTLETTGIYHEELALFLFEHQAQVVVANPHHTKHYGKGLGIKTKNDKRDSFVLAHYGLFSQPDLWQPESLEIRQLKALIARLDAIDKDIQQKRNRLEKATCANSPEDVILSLNKTISHLLAEQQRFEKLIQDHIDQNPTLKQDKQLLQSIPGVGTTIATRMIALLRSRSFSQASQVAAFCGLVPIEKLSGSSVRGKPCLSKAGPSSIRAKLYMATLSATQWNPIIHDHYQQLIARGKSKMAALCACMRKMVLICFGVIKHQQPFHHKHQQ